MTKENHITYAYIDGANLEKGLDRLGWKLDYKKFRIWLSDKYSVEKAYLFLGIIPNNADLYTDMQKIGFTIIFKEVTRSQFGTIKGNCDTDLVLMATCDSYESRYSKAIVVSSDGDYACLIKFLKSKEMFRVLISPDNTCSFLLRKINIPIVHINSQRNHLELAPIKEKALDGDKTP